MSTDLIERPLEQSLDQLADRINAEHDACCAAVGRGMEHALAAGQMLSAVKERLPHGEFQEWVTQHCDFSARTARGYLRLAKRWPTLDEAKRQRAATLSFRQATLLLADETANAKTGGGKPRGRHLRLPTGAVMVVHEFAMIYPWMSEDQIIAMVASIAQYGLLNPVTMYEGQILDGKNRVAACAIADVPVRTTEFMGTRADALEYTWSMNIVRRHATESQIAAAVVQATHMAAMAAEKE